MPDKASPDLPPTPSAATISDTGPKAGVVQGPETKTTAPPPVLTEAASTPPPPISEQKPVAVDLPKPPPASVPEPASPRLETKQVSPEPNAKTTEAASASPRSAPLPVAPAQTATAVPAGTLVHHTSIWIAGFVLAGFAVSLVFLLRRRAHAAPGASLITQSFERKNKP
jgi:outer membrane biosynthesis protein TonB